MYTFTPMFPFIPGGPSTPGPPYHYYNEKRMNNYNFAILVGGSSDGLNL